MIKTLKEVGTNNILYPKTDVSAVLKENGESIEANLIPDGGSQGQILQYTENGVSWDYPFKNYTDILAYGVEWDVTVADPHLTRIGNRSLHKTLPIQSQLKGCIAQGNKIMYWLNEEDWHFRKDPVYIEGEPLFASVGTVHTTFNTANQSVECSVGQKVRLSDDTGDSAEGTITDITGDIATITWEAVYDAVGAHAKVEIGANLTGYDGTVRVYCPSFYIKSEIDGNKRRVWLSTMKIDSTWTHQPEILVDAYKCTVLNAVPKNMGYLSTLPVNSAISVVNTSDYCRGGNNNTAYDKYLETDPYRTQLGKPRTNIARSNMRTYARNASSEILSYDQYKNIFYWLYVVEYANFNCQEAYNEELTAEGYHQGGMGEGVTNWNSINLSNYNSQCPLTPCGYTNEFGNKTGVKSFTTVAGTDNLDAGTTSIPAITSVVPRWRGFENPFGDIQTNLDGIIIDADVDNHPNNMNYVYTCQDPTKYADNLNGDGYEKVGEEIYQEGYTKLFDLGDAAHIIPNVMGSNTTQYKCDYHYVGSKGKTLKTLLVGGRENDGAAAGLGSFLSSGSTSYPWADVGFRLVSISVSFPGSK